MVPQCFRGNSFACITRRTTTRVCVSGRYTPIVTLPEEKLVRLHSVRRAVNPDKHKLNETDPWTPAIPTERTTNSNERYLRQNRARFSYGNHISYFSALAVGILEDRYWSAGEDVSESELRFPLTLGAICRAWRQIAWSTPTLWTFMCLKISHVKQLSPTTKLVEIWISRSGRLLNTIIFSSGSRSL